MKRYGLAISALAMVIVAGCGMKPVASVTESPTQSASDAPRTANVVSADSTVDCSATSTTPTIVDQGDFRVNDVDYKVAIVRCDTDSAVVVESFAAAGSDWASNGLVAGPDLAVNVTGKCVQNEKTMICPAQSYAEDDSTISGTLKISSVNNDFSWTFVAD